MIKKIKKIGVFLFCMFIFVPAFSLEAVVVSVLGKAEVRTAKGWEPMKTGTKIVEGAIISTGFKSQAVLGIGKSTVTVHPLSRLTLQQLTQRQDTDISKIYLDAGSIRADVKAAENKRVGFTVKSPVATASVRGTAGVIDAFGLLESTSGVWTLAPDTDIDTATKGVWVAKGSSAAVQKNGTIAVPQLCNVNSAVSASPINIEPSVTETSNTGITSASGAAQNAAGNQGSSGRIRINLDIGWKD